MSEKSENTTLNQSILFAEASPVSRIQSAGRDSAQAMIVSSGLRCLESYLNLTPNGLSGKTFLESLLTAELNLNECAAAWRLKGMRCSRRLIFQLALLDYKRWNGTHGLLQRPLASDSKGAKKY